MELKEDEKVKPVLITPTGPNKTPDKHISAQKGFSLKKTFAALSHRNYKLWFWGQMISMFGTWMQVTAEGFLVYQLTGSPLFLGYVGFASGLPTWLFMLYGGVIADRIPKRTVLIATQTFEMLLPFTLATLVLTGNVRPWHIVVLAFLLGTANAFDAPARQAFIPELVSRKNLSNAIALNSTMFNSATAVGPAVAGVTYALFGPAWCFIINGISFIGVIIALLMMKIEKVERIPSKKSAFEDLKEGVKYVFSNKRVRVLAMSVTMTSIFGISFATLFPAWAVNILGGDASTNGLLQSARGIGALTCALFIASLGSFTFKGKLLTTGMFAFPILAIIFTFIHSLPFALLDLFVIGFSMILIFNLSNNLLQELIPDNLRGRVMAVYSMTFFGFMPLGALLIGTTAEHTSEPIAISIFAGILLCYAIFVWLRFPKLRKLE